MEAPRSQFAVKWLPSLTDFAFLMPVALLFGKMGGVNALLSDCDTGWHIRTGDWIVTNRLIPTHDVFSFSKPGGVWFAWEWLSDVLFASLNSAAGLRAVVLFSLLLLCVTFALLFRLVRQHANPVVAFVITIIAAAASSVHWLARPHLFTMFFLVVFCGVLERVRCGQTHIGGLPWFVLLPVLTVLWTNLHGGFFVGIMLLGIYGAGELAGALFSADQQSRRPAVLRARRYFGTALGCLVASLVNPYTYRLHLHLWQYLRDPYASRHIGEFLSLSFHHPIAIFFESMLLLAGASIFWYGSHGRFIEPLQLLVWGHVGLLAARNIPIFMIVAAPIVARAAQVWLAGVPKLEVAGWVRAAAKQFNRRAARLAETDALPRWHAISLAGVALVAALLFAPAPPKHFRSEYDPKSYPAAAINVLRRDPSARIFTNDEWGDYLIWRLYPAGRVFVDGRSDFYGADFEEKYIDVLNVKYNWEQILSDFQVDTILLPPSAPLTGALKESSRWRVVYDDGVALVFRSLHEAGGTPISVASLGSGAGRDREVTKTQARDQAITDTKPKI